MNTSISRTLYVTRILRSHATHPDRASQRNRSTVEKLFETEQINVAMIVLLTTIAFALRFYKINHPDEVVYVCLAYARVAPCNTCTATQIR